MRPNFKRLGKAVGIFLLLGFSIFLGCTYISNLEAKKTGNSIQALPNQTLIATNFDWPLHPIFDYAVTGYHYMQYSEFTGAAHPGIDLNKISGEDENDLVYAVANGTVMFSGWVNTGFGNIVVIDHQLPDHSHIWSAYGHLSQTLVTTGDILPLGYLIGRIGNTGCGKCGPHLHWEIRLQPHTAGWGPAPGVGAESLFDEYVEPIKFVSDFKYYGRLTDKVTLFEDSYFRGAHEDYWPGYTDMVAFESALDNKVSSVAIPPGWMVNLYDQPGQSPHAEVFDTDVKLSDNPLSSGGSIDDRTSAIKVLTSQQCSPGLLNAANAEQVSWVASSCNPDPDPAPGPQPVPDPVNPPINPGQRVVLCKGENFTDCKYEFNVGAYKVTHQEYGSISAPSGWSFILKDWTDGHESCYNQSLSKLGDHESWRFNIDQITVIDSNVCTSGGGHTPGPLGNDIVRFWTSTSFTGGYLQLGVTNEANTYWMKDFTGSGFNFNDDFESFELNTTNNRSVALYRDSLLQGPAKCFTSSAQNLWSYKFNDGNDVANQASSARFFVGIGCDLRPQVPSEIWVHSAEKSKVVLTWPWGGPDDDGYYIYLFDGSTYQRVATIGWNDARQNAQNLGLSEEMRSWTFSPASCSGQYSFVVSAWNEFGESAMTHSVTAVTPDCDCTDVVKDGITLFEQPYCRGSYIDLVDPGRVSLINFNDQTSAVHVAPGWSLEVFENTDSSDGLATCLTGDKWDLSLDPYWPEPNIIGGTVSNVRAFHDGTCGRQLPIVGCGDIQFDGVALFDYSQCLGEDRLFNQPGFYNLFDFDNQPSSIHVGAGWSVRVWDENTRQGKYVCFNGSKWDLSYDPYSVWDPTLDPPWDTSYKANNNITSLEIFSDTLCGGINPPVLFDPADTYTVTSNLTDLTLRWQQDFSPGYWAELWWPDGSMRSSGYLGVNEWHIGAQLPPGMFTWRVRAENFGVLSDWSQGTFVVQEVAVPRDILLVHTVDPVMKNHVEAAAIFCSHPTVHFNWGDGTAEFDQACVDGVARTSHDYPLVAQTITYTLVADYVFTDQVVIEGQSVDPITRTPTRTPTPTGTPTPKITRTPTRTATPTNTPTPTKTSTPTPSCSSGPTCTPTPIIVTITDTPTVTPTYTPSVTPTPTGTPTPEPPGTLHLYLPLLMR